MDFCVFVCSSFYFFSVLQFSEYRPFTSLVTFIPRYFILSETIVSGIVFLISLHVSSLSAYKNATEFWILISYPTTLLSSFISPSRFLVESLGFSMYRITSSANKDSFSSSFPIWMPCFSSCLIAVARTSSTVLNKRGECRHPCLASSLKGTLLDFAH